MVVILKDSDDDCLNNKKNNLFKASMNRIDNTHATFLNCLRDWNDPFLLGHKPIKVVGCQRCESCACRSVPFSVMNLSHSNLPTVTTTTTAATTTNSNTSANSTSANTTQTSNGGDASSSSVCQSLLNDHPHNHHHHHHHHHNHTPFYQPITRCKSSTNVPKTIDQCIKLCKSRPRPSSIKSLHSSRKLTHLILNTNGQNNANDALISKSKSKTNLAIVNNNNIASSSSSKVSHNSIESDKESTTDTMSKDDDFRHFYHPFSPNCDRSQSQLNLAQQSSLLKRKFVC